MNFVFFFPLFLITIYMNYCRWTSSIIDDQCWKDNILGSAPLSKNKNKDVDLLPIRIMYDISIFGFMHESWTNPTTNMMYTGSQNYRNMVDGEHRMQTFETVVVVMLLLLFSFDAFVPTNAHPLLVLDKSFCSNVLKC